MLRQSATMNIYYLYQTKWHQKIKNYIDALDNSHWQIIYRHLMYSTYGTWCDKVSDLLA